MSVFSLTFDVVNTSAITLPVRYIDGSVSITWGDGITTTATNTDISGLSHTYTSARTAAVSITGSFTSFGTNGGWIGNTLLKTVTAWNTTNLITVASAFEGCTSLTSVPGTINPSIVNTSSMLFIVLSYFQFLISQHDQV